MWLAGGRWKRTDLLQLILVRGKANGCNGGRASGDEQLLRAAKALACPLGEEWSHYTYAQKEAVHLSERRSLSTSRCCLEGISSVQVMASTGRPWVGQHTSAIGSSHVGTAESCHVWSDRESARQQPSELGSWRRWWDARQPEPAIGLGKRPTQEMIRQINYKPVARTWTNRQTLPLF